MDILIRRARPDEADLLTELSMRSKQSNGYDDAFMEACRDELTVTASRMAAGEYWVAVARGDARPDRDAGICGCVCLVEGAGAGEGEVHAFFIDPASKRRGIGRRLWRKLVERAAARGFKTLRLDADPAAVPFYRAMGFSVAGEAPSGSIEGRMLPRMICRLA
jgi:ribosomal protein S18 acetylase RimI-like enzyme